MLQEDGEPIVQALDKKKTNRRRAKWRARGKRSLRQSRINVSTYSDAWLLYTR